MLLLSDSGEEQGFCVFSLCCKLNVPAHIQSLSGKYFFQLKMGFKKVWGSVTSDQLNLSEQTQNCGCSRQCTALGEIFAEQLLQLKQARSSSQGLGAGDARYVQPLVVCPPTTHLCVHSTSV